MFCDYQYLVSVLVPERALLLLLSFVVVRCRLLGWRGMLETLKRVCWRRD